MKLPKTVMAALLIGMAVQSTGCKKDNDTQPSQLKNPELTGYPDNKKPMGGCPACGMG